MATDSGYARGDYLRTCDICGVRFHISALSPIGEMKWACPDDAPGLTALQISRHNARVRPVIVRPNKHGKDYISLPIYQLAEAQVFNFIAKAAPADDVEGTNACLPAAWACIYMAEVVIQARRPQIWVSKAKQVIATCCTFLLTRQAQESSFFPYPVTDPRYGGLTDTAGFTGDEFSAAVFSTEKTIAGGIAFALAYQATGNTSYLAAARRCGRYLRHVQAANLHDTAPNRNYVGGFASEVTDDNADITHTYLVGDVLGGWLLALLAEIDGASTEYGDASSVYYISPTTATITEMLADLRVFAETGVVDTGESNALTPGLSATAPRQTYTASTSTWGTDFTIAADVYARGLLGVYKAFGLTSQVTAIMAMLSGLTVNPANATPAGTTEAAVMAGITGDFDPSLCPPVFFTTEANSEPLSDVSGSSYDWASLGLLSPILSEQGSLRTSKDALSTARRYSLNVVDLRYLALYGFSGYSFQTALFGRSVTRAAKAAMAYRHDPGRYPSLRGN